MFRLQKEIKKHVLSAALKKGVADGTLVQVKASYKLSAEAKKKKPAAWIRARPDGCPKCRYCVGCTPSCYKYRGEPLPGKR